VKLIKRTNRPPRWPWVLGIIVGLAVFGGVAAVVPGDRCADGTSSNAIGRRGACSHHGGVSSGWTFLGVPAGLFAGMLSYGMLEALEERRAERRRDAVRKQWEQVARAPVPANAAPPVRVAGEDLQGYLRRVMAAGCWIVFQYRDGDVTARGERTVRPRWLQLADAAGKRTLCLVGDCSVDGRRTFALSLMDSVVNVEPVAAD